MFLLVSLLVFYFFLCFIGLVLVFLVGFLLLDDVGVEVVFCIFFVFLDNFVFGLVLVISRWFVLGVFGCEIFGFEFGDILWRVCWLWLFGGEGGLLFVFLDNILFFSVCVFDLLLVCLSF